MTATLFSTETDAAPIGVPLPDSAAQTDPALSSDAAIESRTADLLGRRRFAERLAATVRRRVGEESIVIALMGPWGCGKTSIKNMMLDALAEHPDSAPAVVQFEPWLWKKPEELTAAFFHEVGLALGESDDRPAALWTRYAANFAAVAPGTTGLAGALMLARNPGGATLGSAMARLPDVAASVRRGQEPLAATAARRTLDQQRRELRDALQTLERPVLVIMDDLDRIGVAEVPLILQLIKANANFPNLIYLLLFQRESVERCLEAAALGVGRSSGRDFLEKIVQVPFDVPVAAAGSLVDALRRGLADALGPDLQVRLAADKRSLFTPAVMTYFENLRDVRRFVNGFAFTVSMFRSEGEAFEVNPVDLVLLEVIRLFEPDVYSRLPLLKPALTEPRPLDAPEVPGHRHTGSGAAAPYPFGALLALARQPDVVRAILRDAFPSAAWALGDAGDLAAAAEVNGRDALRDLRACHPALFDRYFQLAVPQNDLPQSDLRFLLALTGDADRLLSACRSLAARDLLIVAVERLATCVAQIPADHAPAVVGTLLALDTELVSADPTARGRGEAMVAQCIQDLLLSDDDALRRSDRLRRAVERSPSLWLPAHVVRRDIAARKRRRPAMLTEPDADAACRACARRIEDSALAGELIDHPMFTGLLYRWQEWGDHSQLSAYLSRLIAMDEGLLRFLQSWVVEAEDLTLSDHRSQPKRTLLIGEMTRFIAADAVAARVRTLAPDALSGESAAPAREAVTLFLQALPRAARNGL